MTRRGCAERAGSRKSWSATASSAPCPPWNGPMWWVVVIDAIEGVTEQDAKIAGIAHERGKGIIVAVNKWDAIEKTDKTIYEYTRKIKEILSFIYAEFLFISAATGQRLTKLFEMIDVVRQNQNLRVATGVSTKS